MGGDGRSTKWSTGSPARTAGPRDPGRHPHRPRPRWGPARSGCRVIPPAPSSASRIGGRRRPATSVSSAGRADAAISSRLVGTGFDAVVAARALTVTGPGTVPYLRAVLTSLRDHRPWRLQRRVEGAAARGLAATAVMLANGATCGGGMRIAPDAQPRGWARRPRRIRCTLPRRAAALAAHRVLGRTSPPSAHHRGARPRGRRGERSADVGAVRRRAVRRGALRGDGRARGPASAGLTRQGRVEAGDFLTCHGAAWSDRPAMRTTP